jgi:hypothetical protein
MSFKSFAHPEWYKVPRGSTGRFRIVDDTTFKSKHTWREGNTFLQCYAIVQDLDDDGAIKLLACGEDVAVAIARQLPDDRDQDSIITLSKSAKEEPFVFTLKVEPSVYELTDADRTGIEDVKQWNVFKVAYSKRIVDVAPTASNPTPAATEATGDDKARKHMEEYNKGRNRS